MRTVYFSAVGCLVLAASCGSVEVDPNIDGNGTGNSESGTSERNVDEKATKTACHPKCAATETCILQPDGNMGCVASANINIYDEIRTEVAKASNATERPLPLAAVWCSGPTNEAKDMIFERMQVPVDGDHNPATPPTPYTTKEEGGPVDLELQLRIIAGQEPHFGNRPSHHLLPTLDVELPKGNNAFNDRIFNFHANFPTTGGYDPSNQGGCKVTINPDTPNEKIITYNPPCNEQDLLEFLMKTPLEDASLAGLPLTVYHLQPEDMLKSDQLYPSYSAITRDQLLHCEALAADNHKAFNACTLSALHANSASAYQWIGQQMAIKNQLQKYQQWYPAPQSLIFLNNNEADTDRNWLDSVADEAAIWQPGAPGVNFSYDQIDLTSNVLFDPNAAYKAHFDSEWVDRYKIDMRGGLESALLLGSQKGKDWRSAQKRYVAYTSDHLAFQDHTSNEYFKTDKHTYVDCCAAYSTTAACVNALAANTDATTGLMCYRPGPNQPGPPEQCTGQNTTSSNILGCFQPATPRASLGHDTLFALNNQAYDNGNPNIHGPEQQRHHFIDNGWPVTSSSANQRPPNIDRIYRSWDGTSLTGGSPIAPCYTRSTSPCDNYYAPWSDFMTGPFLLHLGYTAVLLDQLPDNFWGETYSVALSDTVGNLLYDQGISGTVCSADYGSFLNDPINNWRRAIGVSQLGLWMHRPRVVRNFDVCMGGNLKFDFTATFLRADVDAVDMVWDDPDLRDFWKNSVLVENAAYSAIFQQRGVAKAEQNFFGAEQKYWFLKTNQEMATFSSFQNFLTLLPFDAPCTDDAQCKGGKCLQKDPLVRTKTCGCLTANDCPEQLDASEGKAQVNVVAIARVQNRPNGQLRRYLVYAFTQLDTVLNNVDVTVPDSAFGVVRINDVKKQGTFCIVDDLPAIPGPATCSRTFSIPDPTPTSLPAPVTCPPPPP